MELIVVVIPDFGVPAVMAGRPQERVKAAIIAAGFSETIPEGLNWKEVLSIAKEAGFGFLAKLCGHHQYSESP